jgi:hypothetical protein
MTATVKTAALVHLPIQEARHVKARLALITVGDLAKMSDTVAESVVEAYQLIDTQLRELDKR